MVEKKDRQTFPDISLLLRLSSRRTIIQVDVLFLVFLFMRLSPITGYFSSDLKLWAKEEVIYFWWRSRSVLSFLIHSFLSQNSDFS